MVSPPRTPTRKPLHERSHSQLNAAIRLVPYSPPRLPTDSRKTHEQKCRPATTDTEGRGTYLDYSSIIEIPRSSKGQVYSRTPVPTTSAHILPPPGFLALDGSAQTIQDQSETQGSRASVKQHYDDVSQDKSTQSPAVAIRSLQSKVSLPRTQQSQSSDEAIKAKPLLRRKKEVSVDPGSKTFKITDFLRPASKPEILPNVTQSDRQTIPARAPTTPVTTHEFKKQSLGENDLGHDNQSTASCKEDSNIVSGDIATSTPVAISGISEDHITSDLPSDVDLVGGLRIIIPGTSVTQQSAVDCVNTSSPILVPAQNSNLVDFTGSAASHHTLSQQHSFETIASVSSLSATTNYKVYGISPDSTRSQNISHRESSDTSETQTRQPDNPLVVDNLPVSAQLSSEGSPQPNYEVYGASSSVPSSIVFSTSEPNFIIHDQALSSKASQDSLAYSFLAHDPHRTSFDGDSYRYRPSTDTYRTYRTQESSTSKGKIRQKTSRDILHTRDVSLTSSIGTFISAKEAKEAVRHKSSIIHLPALKTPILWAAGKGPLAAKQALMQATPHVWSSQLSTVASESESSVRGSRSLSQFSMLSRGNYISSPISEEGRELHSMASIEGLVYADTLSRPIAAHINSNGGTNWDVNLEDEDGDVLEDMPRNLRPQRSKARLSGLLNSASSESGRTNTMKSTASTKSMTGSMYSRTIPEWARVYYGSGERKFLVAPPSSHGGDSRPPSNWSRSGSPDTSNFPQTLFSPRRRPRDGQANVNVQRHVSVSTASRRSYRPGTTGSMAIRPVHSEPDAQVQHAWIHRIKSRTSSIWSPHLGRDRRAEAQSAWVAPSMIWSDERGVSGTRNRQMIMFILGFVFPFSWMIAAFLPVSKDSGGLVGEMEERSGSNASNEELHPRYLRDPAGNEYEIGLFDTDAPQGLGIQLSPADEKRLRSARWWRNLNRWMSVIGLIILATITTLIVIGIREGWTQS